MKRNYINTYRWLFALLLLCSAGVAMAQKGHEKTTDKVTLSKLQVSPGGDFSEDEFITVGLEGNTIYTAFGMDIYLPDGYEFVMDNNEPMVYISTEGMYTVKRGQVTSHLIGANIQPSGALRVTASSNSSAEMLKTTGALFDVYVRATPYAKEGPAVVRIDSCFFVTTDAVQYDAYDQEISNKLSASSDCSLPFSFTAAKKWSTRVFPFSMEVPEGMSVYTYKNQDEENVYLTKQDKIEAYVPYVISAESNINTTLTGTARAEEYTSRVLDDGICGTGILKGAVTNQSVDEGYVLQSQDGGECMFYPILDGDVFTIPSGKCWLTLPASGVKGLNFVISDEADEIQNIETRPRVSAIYDLQGRSVTATQHGVYIIDGKKVIK